MRGLDRALHISLGNTLRMKASIVIRTLNEAEHLPALLAGIATQDFPEGEIETVIVDSGSTDGTIELAKRNNANLVHIAKADFSFGRSLNLGCQAATGEALVFISGHCIPASTRWVGELIAPLLDGQAAYSYGKQIGGDATRFSETRIFAKYFPEISRIPQDGFFCNNANSALLMRVWANNPFDETLTGLEDMHLAKRLVSQGHAVAYVAEAPVFHLHDENWRQIRRRFEREAIALQHIMPDVHVSWADFARYVTSAILLDMGAALQQRRLRKAMGEIVLYRFMQFWGSYRGSHMQRNLSRKRREEYFYPR